MRGNRRFDDGTRRSGRSVGRSVGPSVCLYGRTEITLYVALEVVRTPNPNGWGHDVRLASHRFRSPDGLLLKEDRPALDGEGTRPRPPFATPRQQRGPFPPRCPGRLAEKASAGPPARGGWPLLPFVSSPGRDRRGVEPGEREQGG
jgi:hypothetical protein